MSVWALVALVLLAAEYSMGFYLPGVAPRAYMQDESLPILVNRLDSADTLIPFDYYSFDFCKHGEEPYASEGQRKTTPKVSENLGQILLGERIFHSAYDIRMKQDMFCKPLCKPKSYNMTIKPQAKIMKKLIFAVKKEYLHHWIADNLPIVECIQNCNTDQPQYRMGFPIGCYTGDGKTQRRTTCTAATRQNMDFQPGKMYLNNHIDFTISYHESNDFEGSRVVGIVARARSIYHDNIDNLKCSSDQPPLEIDIKATPQQNFNIIYTYSVVFQYSEIRWVSRWDAYLKTTQSIIHWFSIVNSLLVVVFLSAMIALILMRTLRRDIARYNEGGDSEAQEEFGWKLIHGDVFRPPSYPLTFSVIIGNGLQLVAMLIVTLIFACFGFLSPATRGGLMTSLVLMYVLFSALSGYASARLYKLFDGQELRNCVLVSASCFTVIIFSIFFIINLVLWYMGSSAAVPIGTLIVLLLLWLGLSVPLTFVGAYYGYKEQILENAVRTNLVPRAIPPQRWFNRPIASVLLGGLLPFASLFIQLYFIFSSIWGANLYYIFGFLTLVFVIWAITTIESTILLVYFSLCSENHRWYWKSIQCATGATFYLFIYTVIFYFRELEVDGPLNFAIYSGYSLILLILYWVASAAIGFLGTFVFVRTIFTSVKAD